MFGLGMPELLLIFFVILLLFGAKRLPELAQGLGKGIREFKKAMKDTEEDVKGSVDVANRPPANQIPPQYTQPNQPPYNPPPYNPPPSNQPKDNKPNQNN